MKKKLDFIPPQGAVPAAVAEGEEFDLVCTWRVKGDGRVCLVKFGETDVDYDKEEKGRKGPYSKEANDMAHEPMNPKGESY